MAERKWPKLKYQSAPGILRRQEAAVSLARSPDEDFRSHDDGDHHRFDDEADGPGE